MHFDPLFVSEKGQFGSSDISNILRSSGVPIQGHVHLFIGVIRVLLDNTPFGLAIGRIRFVVPPLKEIAMLVEVPSIRIESVNDFVGNDHADASIDDETKREERHGGR